MEHTPTPWKISTITADEVSSEKGVVCECFGVTQEEEFANAAFIVRACNAHDELVEACKISLARLLAIDEVLNNQNNGRRNHAIYLLSQAIAKAEGK